jgi:hypothetical protein
VGHAERMEAVAAVHATEEPKLLILLTAISQAIGIVKPDYSSPVFLLRSNISDMLGFREGLVATSGISMVRVNCTTGMYKPWAMAV